MDIYVVKLLQPKIKEGEVGSSAIPQNKSIDFENAEGNLGIASIFGYSKKTSSF